MRLGVAFKVWSSLYFSDTVHHIAFKLGMGLYMIYIYIYYTMGSHRFKFYCRIMVNLLVYMFSCYDLRLGVAFKVWCSLYFSETVHHIVFKLNLLWGYIWYIFTYNIQWGVTDSNFSVELWSIYLCTCLAVKICV